MNWHQKYREKRTFGEKLADNVASTMGSWKFIIFQTVIIVAWIIVNIIGILYEWDKYPFILLNLLFSTQAAYSAPIIMMSQNRQNIKDRVKAEEDYNTNSEAKREIELLIRKLDKIEIEKLDRILEKLEIEALPTKEAYDNTEERNKTVLKLYPNPSEFPERIAFAKGADWQLRQLKKK